MVDILKFIPPHCVQGHHPTHINILATLSAFCQINVGARCRSQNERKRRSHVSSHRGKNQLGIIEQELGPKALFRLNWL